MTSINENFLIAIWPALFFLFGWICNICYEEDNLCGSGIITCLLAFLSFCIYLIFYLR